MKAADVVAPAQRQGGELEGRDPALGPALEGGHVAGVEVQAHAVEVRRRLAVGEPQVGRPYLDQLAPRPQPGERQRRVGPAGDDQVHLGGEVVEEEPHRLVDLDRLDEVVVVEDEDQGIRGGELVDERGEHRGHRRGGRVEKGGRGLADVGHGRPQRRDHVAPEGHRLVVALVQ